MVTTEEGKTTVLSRGKIGSSRGMSHSSQSSFVFPTIPSRSTKERVTRSELNYGFLYSIPLDAINTISLFPLYNKAGFRALRERRRLLRGYILTSRFSHYIFSQCKPSTIPYSSLRCDPYRTREALFPIQEGRYLVDSREHSNPRVIMSIEPWFHELIRTIEHRDQAFLNALSKRHHHVRLFILSGIANRGMAPSVQQLCMQFELKLQDIEQILQDLQEKEQIYRPRGTNAITAAYPLSSVPAKHMVTIEDGREMYALSAFDALGIPFLFQQGGTISTCCAHCDQKLQISFNEEKHITQAGPDISLWFQANADDYTALHRNPNIGFLCHPRELQPWIERNGVEHQGPVTLADALWGAASLFRHKMATEWLQSG